MVKALLSILALTGGALFAWHYRRPPPLPADETLDLRGDRPWRRVGAVLCLVVSLMFVAGLYLVDVYAFAAWYALYWLVLLFLVLWLCVLAVRDVLYTRHLIERQRVKRDADRMDAPLSRSPKDAES